MFASRVSRVTVVPDLDSHISTAPLPGYLFFVCVNGSVLCLSIVAMAFAIWISRGVAYAVVAFFMVLGGAGTYVCWEPNLLVPSHQLLFAWAFLMYIPVSARVRDSAGLARDR